MTHSADTAVYLQQSPPSSPSGLGIRSGFFAAAVVTPYILFYEHIILACLLWAFFHCRWSLVIHTLSLIQRLCHKDTGNRERMISLRVCSTSQGLLPFLLLSRLFTQIVKTPWHMYEVDPGSNKSSKLSVELTVSDSKMQKQPNGRENWATAWVIWVISAPGLAWNFCRGQSQWLR